MNKSPRFLIAGLMLLLGACASLPKERVEEKLQAGAPQAQRLDVEFIAQEKNMCGPSVLKMATGTLAPGYTLQTLKEMSFREDAQGTFKSDLLSASRRMGLAPYRVSNIETMLAQIQAGNPVIVFQNLGVSWLSAWHFSLLVGYDAKEDVAYLHSGDTAYSKVPFRRFTDTWYRGEMWSYVVLSPSEIPSQSSFDEALDNAMLLEQLNKDPQARELYQAMAKRWPNRFEPHLGLANIYYQEKNIPQAIAQSEQALQRNPEHSALLFNLASLYHEIGEKKKAQLFKERTLATAPDSDKEEYSQRLGF